eukprot:4846856-Alexandrium_andersonii.AAC.1
MSRKLEGLRWFGLGRGGRRAVTGRQQEFGRAPKRSWGVRGPETAGREPQEFFRAPKQFLGRPE